MDAAPTAFIQPEPKAYLVRPSQGHRPEWTLLHQADALPEHRAVADSALVLG